MKRHDIDQMYALLIFSQNGEIRRIMVKLKERETKERVLWLLEGNKGREAFDLLKARAQVEAFLPEGAKLPVAPQVTLVEDML